MKKPQYYVTNKLTPPKAFFDWCYSQLPVYQWKNKDQTIVSSDRTTSLLINKRLTKNSKLTFDEKFYSFVIILSTSKRIEIQSYGIWFSITNGKEEITTKLVNMQHFSNNRAVKIGLWYKNEYIFGLVPNFSGFGGAYERSVFYKNSWFEKLQKSSELKYLSLDKKKVHYSTIERLYKYRSEVEFLQKIKANTFANDIMYETVFFNRITKQFKKKVDMRSVNKSWLKKNKACLVNTDNSFYDFELERRIKERNGTVVPGIKDYLNYSDISRIPKKIGIIRFQNWIIKNNIDFNEYLDYLNVLKELKITPDYDLLIIPKNFKLAHDEAVEKLNVIKKEVFEGNYHKEYENLKIFNRTINGYDFIIPPTLSDILLEGKHLRHCVGNSTYINAHRDRRATIVFIRDSNCPNTSLYTLEMINFKIIQIRGFHNQTPPPQVTELALDYLKWCQQPHTKRKLVA